MRVILIPGFAGTELFNTYALSPGELGGKVWVDSFRLATGRIVNVDINAAGDGPGPLAPRGISAVARLAMRDFYGSLIDAIRAPGRTVMAVGWDWRLSLVQAAAAIRASVDSADATDDIAIVAHSAGGLVARLVAKIMDDHAELSRLKRIVYLGTPQSGTYYPLATVARQTDEVHRLQSPLGRVIPGGGPVPTDTLLQLLARFVSLWEILPFKDYGYYHDLKPAEVNRLYDASYYAGVNSYMLQSRLDGAVRTQALLRQAVYPALEAVVYGTGQSTPAGVEDGPLHDAFIHADYAPTGDGTVEQGSAARPDITTRISSAAWSHSLLVQDGDAIRAALSFLP